MNWLVIHAGATFWMAGVIWVVQLVHYPMFHDLTDLSSGAFRRAMEKHVRRMTWVVGPAMLIEAATVWVALDQSLGHLGAGLLLIAWLSTALLQVPAHNQLAIRADPDVVHRLVRSNWIRTVAWTARAGLVGYLLLVTGA